MLPRKFRSYPQSPPLPAERAPNRTRTRPGEVRLRRHASSTFLPAIFPHLLCEEVRLAQPFLGAQSSQALLQLGPQAPLGAVYGDRRHFLASTAPATPITLGRAGSKGRSSRGRTPNP